MSRLALLSLTVLAIWSLPSSAQAGQGDRLVKAQLLADTAAVQPGKPFQLGVLLKIESSWHIYWKNAGDSGLPTRVKLKLPPGFTAGEVQFPVPTRIDLPGDIANFAYENEVMLIVPVTPPAELASGAPLTISADVNWLVCQEQCMPGKASVSLDLPVSNSATGANTELFGKWMKAMPTADASATLAGPPQYKYAPDVGASGPVSGDVSVTLRWKTPPKSATWFPEELGDNARLKDLKIKTDQGVTTITFAVAADKAADLPKRVDGVLAFELPDGTRRGVSFAVPLMFSPGG